MDFIARRYDDGSWVRVRSGRDGLLAVKPTEGPESLDASDDWTAPAFWDIQTNGRRGVSFSDPDLTPESAAEVIRAHAGLGTARLCPTLITAPTSATISALRALATACERWPEVGRMVLGFHLEGPWIAPEDGYRGAHPIEAVRDPDLDSFREFQGAAGGRIVLVTLAPERPGALMFIRALVEAGVRVALGHTRADGPNLRAAVEAGASLSTHLGNGIAATLPRHPNPILDQAADDRLFASVIADGHHLDPSALKVIARAKGPARLILVSDASPLAGLPPGTYGDWAVDPSGKVVVAGTPYLAGSNQDLSIGLSNLMAAGFGLPEAIDTATINPARLLGRSPPRLVSGAAANLVRFRLAAGRVELVETRVGGILYEFRQADT